MFCAKTWEPATRRLSRATVKRILSFGVENCLSIEHGGIEGSVRRVLWSAFELKLRVQTYYYIEYEIREMKREEIA